MPVQWMQREGVATLTLNRPEKMNALNSALRKRLLACLDEVRTTPSIRALIITGSGTSFCAGQDLGEARARSADSTLDLGQILDEEYHPILQALNDLPVPTIAAVHGSAAGAGASLALACDLIIAGNSARFDPSFAKIALIPDCGATWFLPRAIGTQRALAMMLCANSIDAATAAEWGLVMKMVADEALMTQAQAVARRLAQLPTHTLTQIRHAVRLGANHSLNAQLEVESRLQSLCGKDPDFSEGVAAFIEKRPPQFRERS